VTEDEDISEVNGRLCIVTRQSGSVDGDLIRFVAAPDGTVVPDLKRKLPGRGCWVTAERSILEKAVAKNLFARALKTKVVVPDGLADQLDRLLAADLAGMMNMARKAGSFFSGFVKVDGMVRSGEAIAVFHSADAADDGVRKVGQARKAFHLLAETDEQIPAFRPFSAEEMVNLMGENGFIHACALAGKAGEGVVKRARMLERYRSASNTREKGSGALMDK
jgi:uncharacterized protein